MRNTNVNGNKAPLLMTSHGQAFEKQSFYSLKENQYHTTCDHPILSRKRVLGSGYGWLVLVDLAYTAADCFLWNPETTEKIQLPRLMHMPHLYNICVLSKPPTDPNCLVLLNRYAPSTQLICKIGDDAFVEFSTKETKRGHLVAMSSYQGEIYGILFNYDLTSFELATIHLLVGSETTHTVKFKPLLINDENSWEAPQLGRGWFKKIFFYLIESPSGAPGQLLFVTKMLFGVVVEFRVFKVDLNEMKFSEELDNIDGITIFIGHCGNGFCCASQTAGTKSNSIYYTERSCSDVRVYDLDDRSTTELLPPPPPGAHPHKLDNYWVDLPSTFLAAAASLPTIPQN